MEILQNFDHFNLTFPPTNLEAFLLYNFQGFHTDVTFLYFQAFQSLHVKGSDITTLTVHADALIKGMSNFLHQ